ncbi:MAG: sigma-70 family RNA polymerase sigma factor [Alphaproteobacteria bacterium]|nr:sigma-70 family RNA polymerase sigma factor [Alphaproteobacteria bacterium]MBU2082796.1 sigma-70 family RNA polymerase sigma factor [Alphaproteobacteria bacterium]MBU2143081.1 sigma-70 family RNA polymerase sigma factor [Alphaproteobacteria bacterium]MBU2196499.1 sigma-70 family RNA polymerase sigma factor [Alphaproteobacteria bacterium]
MQDRKPIPNVQRAETLRSPSRAGIERAAEHAPPPDPAPNSDANPNPLTQLFRFQYDQLLRFCDIRVGNPAVAEDLVQDAFVAARRAYPDKGIDELRPLLFTTLRNLTVNYLKSGDFRRQCASTEIGDVGDRLACQRSATPERQVMDAQILELAEAVIAAMPHRKREALRLHRFEGLTYDEIADHLSVSRSTVKKDIADAVAEIAERLARPERRDMDPAR